MSKAIITEQHLHDIADAIIAKGGATAPMTPAQMPAAIQKIPSGGDYEKWTEPNEWPDVKSILESDTTQGFTNKIIALFDISNGKTWTLPKKETSGADRYLTSDGVTYEVSSTDITHTFGDSGIIQDRWAWVIMYSNSTLSALIRSSRMNPVVFYYGSDGSEFLIRALSYRSLIAVIVDRMLESPQALYYANEIECLRCKTFVPTGVPSQDYQGFFCAYTNRCFYEITFDEIDFSGITTWPNSLFYGFFGGHVASFPQTVKVIPKSIDISGCNNCSSMFARCPSLTKVPDVLDLSACTNCQSMFANCYSLRAVPDVLDLSVCTNCKDMFLRCYGLRRIPTHVTTNLGISFASSTLVSRDSVAVFDANGNVVGGFVGNLNMKPSDAGTQTIELNSDIKSIFNTDEWTAIKTCLTDKGWAVTPA